MLKKSVENSAMCTREFLKSKLQNTMQDLTDTTSHVQADLRALSVTGVFAAAGVYGSAIPGAPTTGLVRLGRFDLVRYENLKRIARAGRPVMVATPRHSLARAFITSIPSNWTPADGDSLPVTITFLEARVDPFDVAMRRVGLQPVDMS